MGTQMSLIGGSYTAKSIIANCQRSFNLFPEKNTPDSPFPFTYYLTPGLTVLRRPPVPGNARGEYTATNGTLYVVIGPNVYSVNSAWQFTKLGTIPAGSNPVGMGDNGFTLVLVDGTPTGGWLIDLTTNVMTAYADPSFAGSDTVAYLDTFLIFNQPGTKNFYCTLSNTTAIDPLYIAAKTGYPDNLQTLAVVNRQLWLLGEQQSSEVWYDAGNAGFPFAIVPGVFVQQACVAKYSVKRDDLSIFWLGQDQNGKCTVFEGVSYMARKVSTPAIEAEFQNYVVDDAIGMFYEQDGHTFYMLRFPTQDKTWVYDSSQKLWHERGWIDTNGLEHQHRAGATAFAYNVNTCLDWENGTLYAFDTEAYTDAGKPISRIRSWPHSVKGGTRQEYLAFWVDMQAGEIESQEFAYPNAERITQDQALRVTEDSRIRITEDDFLFGPGIPVPPLIFLRWSDDRGRSWGNRLGQSLGSIGEFITSPLWASLGMGRDRVFELSWSTDAKTALNGGWVEMIGAET